MWSRRGTQGDQIADLAGKGAAPHRPVDERVDFFFECHRWSGEPRLQEVDKSADQRWFGLAALPDPVVPHELQVMTALRDGGFPD